jgi:alpha-tubulin suppressor-like RCC1 family protein
MAILDLGKIKLTYKGNWATATAYEKDDIVVHSGGLWICTQTHSASSAGEGLNRLAPGRRGRSTSYGPEYESPDTRPLTIFNVTKSGGKFFINGRRNPNLTFEKLHTYRFHVNDTSMVSINFRFCLTTDGTTYTNGVTVVGTPGLGSLGSYVEITPVVDAPATIRYKQDGTASVADTNSCTVQDVWQGYSYWEELTVGFKFNGVWANGTQYRRNDVVTYDGNLYLALCDSIGEYPNIISQRIAANEWWDEQSTRRNNWTWELLAGGQHTRRNALAGWLENRGPINWPYKNSHTGNPAIYRGRRFYISSRGTIYSQGGDSTAGFIGSYNTSGRNHYWNEVPVEFQDYWENKLAINPDGSMSEDGYIPDYKYSSTGRSSLVNRSGDRPKCIQIETTYSTGYFLFDNGELYVVGSDSSGKAGTGYVGIDQYYLHRVQGLADAKIIKVQCSKGTETSTGHTAALDSEGYVWTWGYNGYGQCGHGHAYDISVPRRIPREYFGGEEIIDLCIVGTSEASTYCRTASNRVYSFGINNAGQLGVGDTTNRWRPTLISSFDPSAHGNNIIRMAGAGNSSGAFFHLLDGNGFMWHAGYNGYGVAVNTTTTNNNSLARSTVAPTAGTTVDFWNSAPAGYSMLWMRTSNGNTYFCGYGGSRNGGENSTTSAVASPGQVVRVQNCAHAFSVATHTNIIRSYWLTDSGELWSMSTDQYGGSGNYLAAGISNVQDGTTYYPYRVLIPSSTKIVDMMSNVVDESTNYYGPNNLVLCDNGQLWTWGVNVGGYINGQANGSGYSTMVPSKRSSC